MLYIFERSLYGESHRYIKKSRLLKFCYAPITSVTFSKGIFAVATNCTDKTNTAGSIKDISNIYYIHLGQYVPLSSLSFLDVYGKSRDIIQTVYK